MAGNLILRNVRMDKEEASQTIQEGWELESDWGEVVQALERERFRRRLQRHYSHISKARRSKSWISTTD